MNLSELERRLRAVEGLLAPLGLVPAETLGNLERSPSATCVQVGVTVEQILRDLWSRLGLKGAPDRRQFEDLYTLTSRKLDDEGAPVPTSVVQAIRQIQSLRNQAAHHWNVSRDDAVYALGKLLEVTHWYFDECLPSLGEFPATLVRAKPASNTNPPEGVNADLAGGFVRPWRGMVALAVVGTVPVVAEFVLLAGPPWPASVKSSALATIVSCLSLAWSYVSFASSKPSRLYLGVRAFSILALSMLTVYLTLTGAFVYDAPTPDQQEAGGFFLQPVVAEILRENRTLSHADILAGAEYDPMRVWEPWTVSLVRVAIFASWVALFGSISATTALVLHMASVRDAL